MTVNAVSPLSFAPLNNALPENAALNPVVFNDLGVPQVWIDAGFCTERGILRFIPLLKTKGISVDGLFQRWIEIGYQNVRMKDYFDALLLEFSDMPCKLYLRGSYATYLIKPHLILQEIVQEFIRQNPQQRALMESVQLNQSVLVEPDDSDWALLFEQPPSTEDLLQFKRRLIEVNATLGNLKLDEAQARTFANLFIAQPNALTQFADPIVITSLKGSPKLDLVVGHLQKAPYLFTCDNHYIRIGQVCIPEFDAQSIVDSCLGIVRAEKRHALDFRALIKAVKHLSQGKKWDESDIRFRAIFQGFLDLPTEVLVKAIQKKIAEGAVEPVSFVLNFLHLVDHPARLQELWQALSHHVTHDSTVTFPEACGGVALYKERFQSSIGFIPQAEGHLHALKGVLLLQRPKQPALVETVAEIVAKESLSQEEEESLAEHLGAKSLFQWLVEKRGVDEAFNYLFRKVKHLSVSEQLEMLRTAPRFKNQLLRYFESTDAKEQTFLVSLEKEILLPDAATTELFSKLFGGYEGVQLIEWLKRVGQKIKSSDKEWVIDLWIALTRQEKIPLTDFQAIVETWLSSRIVDEVKSRCLIKILRAFGMHVFTPAAKQQATPLLIAANLDELENWMLELEDPKPFYEAHRNRLEAAWESLFDKAIALNRVPTLLPCFQTSPHFPALLKAALPYIPAGERLKRIYSLEEYLWDQYFEHLSAEEGHQLQLEILRKTQSFFVLCDLRRKKVPVPSKIEKAALNKLKQVKQLKGPEVAAGVTALIDALQLEELVEILPKLSEEWREETLNRIREVLVNADLDTVHRCYKNQSLRRFIPQDSAWLATSNVSKNQVQNSLDLIEIPDLDPAHFIALCMHLLPLPKTADEELRFLKALFASRSLTAPLLDHLMQSVLKDPESLCELISAHRQQLLDQIQENGETTYQLFGVLERLQIPLPQVVPLSMIRYLKSRLGQEEELFWSLKLLDRPEAASLRFPVLSSLIHTIQIERFGTCAGVCLTQFPKEDIQPLLDQIESEPLWMDQLLHYLKNHSSKSLGALAQAFVERYVLKWGPNAPEPVSTLAELPLNDYEVLAPLLDNENQLVDFLKWLTPMQAILPGIPKLTARIVRQHLNTPLETHLLDRLVSLLVCVCDKQLQKDLEKRALNAYLKEGIGRIENVQYATTEEELRQAVARLAEAATPLKEFVLKPIFRNIHQISAENPSLQWGEEFACQFIRIVRSSPQFKLVHLKLWSQQIYTILICQSASYSIPTRLDLLLYVAGFTRSKEGPPAFVLLLQLVQDIPHPNLKLLEKLVMLSFDYPRPSNAFILEHFCKAPAHELPAENRLRYEMLALLGYFLMKEENSWNERPSLNELLTGICNRAFKLGNVDLSQAPYCQVFGKAFAVISRTNPDSPLHHFDTMMEIIRRYHQISDNAALYSQMLPKLLNQWYFAVKQEDFKGLTETLQMICLDRTSRHFPSNADARNQIFEAFIEQVVTHRFYRGTPAQQETYLLAIMGITKLEMRFYYALFLINLSPDTTFTKALNPILPPSVTSKLINRALEKAFGRGDLTGVQIHLNIFQRALALGFMNVPERKSYLMRLANHLKSYMPDKPQHAKMHLKKFIECIPKNASKQEKLDLHKLITSIIDS